MDRTHIRWFTRLGLIDLFESCGYRLTAGIPRIFADPKTEQFLPAIKAMAVALGADPEQAAKDAMPFQWVMKAVPA